MGRPKKSVAPPAFGQPAEPAHLSLVAAAEWDRLIDEIEVFGLQVTPAHRTDVQPAEKPQPQFLIVGQRAS